VSYEVKDRAFYEASAQIIPVLLLVLAIQTRWFSRAKLVSVFLRRPEGMMAQSIDAFIRTAIYATIVGAELLTLDALRTGHVGAAWRAPFVFYVMVEMLVLIGFMATGIFAVSDDET
jgi:hypothetical protein